MPKFTKKETKRIAKWKKMVKKQCPAAFDRNIEVKQDGADVVAFVWAQSIRPHEADANDDHWYGYGRARTLEGAFRAYDLDRNRLDRRNP